MFLSWSGISSGYISDRLNNLWIREKIFDKKSIKRFTNNIIRKSPSIAVREQKTGGEQEAADLMAHSHKTAEIV